MSSAHPGGVREGMLIIVYENLYGFTLMQHVSDPSTSSG